MKEIQKTLERNSVSGIAQLRHDLQESNDEILQRFGNCLDQVDKRKDWIQAKRDAYQAAKGVFDQWVKNPERF